MGKAPSLPMAQRSGLAEVNGARLWFDVTGEGPSLVLIHGSPLDARMWDQQINAFAMRHQVVRYDVRGYGRSSPPDDAPYRHEDDLAALLGLLGIDRASVVGLSMGGRLAVDFALTYPSAVSALILAGSSLSGFPWTEDVNSLSAEISTAARRDGMPAARRIMLGRHWFQPVRRTMMVRRQLERMINDYSGWHWLHEDPMIPPQPPAFARLEAIAVPALCLVGEHDHLDIHQVAAELTGRIPGTKRVTFPGVGHILNMEHPEAFNRAVIAFLMACEADVTSQEIA
jgi:3-oxoadipate enol-lactonase